MFIRLFRPSLEDQILAAIRQLKDTELLASLLSYRAELAVERAELAVEIAQVVIDHHGSTMVVDVSAIGNNTSK